MKPLLKASNAWSHDLHSRLTRRAKTVAKLLNIELPSEMAKKLETRARATGLDKTQITILALELLFDSRNDDGLFREQLAYLLKHMSPARRRAYYAKLRVGASLAQ